MRRGPLRRSALLLSTLFAVAGAALSAAAESGVDPGSELQLVPEMEEPADILAQPRRERRGFETRSEGRRGRELLAARVAAIWPRIRQVDFAALSRFQVEETRGWKPPAVPGELVARVLGRDAASGHWYLEVRGPRLPARYDIVHRYLWVFARFDPATDKLDRLTVTIRGWVLE